MKIYEKIKRLCSEKAISVNELSKKVGISNSGLSKWDTSSPSLDSLIKVASFFNVPLDYFIDRVGHDTRVEGNGNNNINLANNGDNNSFFAPQQKSQLSEFENQLLELYNSLATPKKMELLNFAFNLKNKEN